MVADGGAGRRRTETAVSEDLTPGAMPGSLPFDHDAIRRLLDDRTAQRGAAYQRQGRVRDLVIANNGRQINGLVRGTRAKPYRVKVAVNGSGKTLWVMGSCSCPVSFDCKHVAAVLYEALGRPSGAPLTVRPSAPPTLPRPDLLAGPVGYWLKEVSAALPVTVGGEAAERVIYLLDTQTGDTRATLQIGIQVVRRLKAGGYGQPRRYGIDTLATSSAAFVQPEDTTIGRLLLSASLRTVPPSLPDDPDVMDLILHRLVGTGRCHWHDKDTPPLTLGPARPANLEWQLLPDGRQLPVIGFLEKGIRPLVCAAPWYVDPVRGQAGSLDFGLPAGLVKTLLAAPPIAPQQAQAVVEALQRDLPGLPVVMPQTSLVEEIRQSKPVPCLHLISVESRRQDSAYWRGGSRDVDPIVDLALLAFDYDGNIVDATAKPQQLRQVDGDRIIVWTRDAKAEQAASRSLADLGLAESAEPGTPRPGGRCLTFPDGGAAWFDFVHHDVPALRAAGWRVEIDPGFRYRVIEADTDWLATVNETGAGWWFSLDLGIEIEGNRVQLLPVLVAALRSLANPAASGALEALALDGTLYAPLPDGRHLALPFDRVRAMLSVLVELFDADQLSADGSLAISLGEAAGLVALEDSLQLRWLGSERLHSLAHDLASFAGVEAVEPPPNLRAILRPYQQAGLDWLQFLHRYGLGGILADDMGLGKTVQTLAHILVEKQAGRLDRPCLVVCPTSVGPNWRAEATRFAPQLRLLALHGPERARAFGDIAAADLVLTTYPLLLRDGDVLLAQDWHLVVLDEAQAIKNPLTKITQLVCRFNARCRLCLSGTPIENHLGELWSYFAFLMPGLLGTHKQFGRLFRTPIEKRGDRERQAALASRLRPFILRRTKAAVAAELPPKTEIVQRIELAGDQRDLYETVRMAMHEKVRQAVAEKGLNRSQIVILDALLKLRQACCDPRLLKLAAARRASTSAKRAALMEMVPELIADGRRILLFSQFTSMLDLIKPELDRARIPFVELRGDTGDRVMPVARFQEGTVPLFLISLKAGGTGLNLTAADTVIHYDPWWNPAVETQATDRAHRIGQDKPVFVYKLIALGTVEERILELQERKRALAGVVFDPKSGGAAGFDQADLELLFRPLG
ncbi:MAG: SNF2-related protein [Betaproteobacteria bacterium]